MGSSLLLQPWLLAGLLVFSVGVTLATSWVVAWLRGASRTTISAGTVIAGLIWASIVFAAGLVAARYIERVDNAPWYTLVFCFLAAGFSMVRAYLYHRHREQSRPRRGWDSPALARGNVWQLGYLFFALVLYLVMCWLASWYADPILFIPLTIGALLPGLDTQRSWFGRLLPFVSHRLEARFGHRQGWHSLGALLLVAVVTIPLVLVAGWAAWAMILLGYVSHLVLDLLKPDGVMLLWPVIRKRFAVFGGSVAVPGSGFENKLVLGLAVSALLLLFLVNLGQPPAPPAPLPSYGETLDRYYALRGRNQVVAAVEGTWQATGRRITDRFEVLSAAGESFVMLDRFTGKVFTAGRGAGDNLYLNRIRLQAGAPVRIQAVEVQLQGEALANALPAIYQMEREPGLQHIYVSGDVILSRGPDDAGLPLAPSYAQTSLRRIQPGDGGQTDGHYRIQYLAASDLIGLAHVEVEAADLVIVATYLEDAPGPTPTALPGPPAPSDGRRSVTELQAAAVGRPCRTGAARP